MQHQFLSDEWIEAALGLQDTYADRVPEPDSAITMNLVITEHPFGDDSIDLHVDNSDGLPRIARGHLDGADVTITTDYATARELFVANDQQAAMQAFMTGRIRIDGDVAKMMAMQAAAATADEELAALRDQIATDLQNLTAD